MQLIDVDDRLYSGLDPELEDLSTLAVSDDPLDSGGFGAIYRCEAINDSPARTPLVVKLFQDNGRGSARQCLDTTRKLQHRIRQKNLELARGGEPGLHRQRGLLALPQVSFAGRIGRREVLGYVAERLDTAGYVPFDGVFEDPALLREYGSLSFTDRLELARDLVQAFQRLWELSFIHADINPQNLFVDPTNRRLEVIDFDSGAVTDHPDDTPSTWGKLSDWLAPELLRQVCLGTSTTNPVQVDRFSDAWAVGIGIHYLLFLFHPLFFLEDLGEDTVRRYLARYDWPQIDRTDPDYNTGNGTCYEAYLQDLRELPQPLVAGFRTLLKRGYTRPSLRPTYQQWSVALDALQHPPTIHLFSAEPAAVIEGMPVRIVWRVEGAQEVVLEPGLGPVADEGTRVVLPLSDQWYRLVARNRSGTVASDPIGVRVWKTPVIQTLLVPTPAIQIHVGFDWVQLAAPVPRIDLDPPAWTTLDTVRLHTSRFDAPPADPSSPGGRPLDSRRSWVWCSQWATGIPGLFRRLREAVERNQRVKP